MQPPHMLVVGASGLVGGELILAAADRNWAVTGAARRAQGDATWVMDLADPASIDAALAACDPALLAICSAWPWVDGCERDPDRSRAENVETVRNVVNATAGSNCRLLFYSTDQVFDGSKAENVESDSVNPLNVYASHKREVEELLLTRGNALVVRTAWVFGVELGRKNFMYQMIRAASGGPMPALPSAQAGCPTWSAWLAASTLTLLEDGLEGVVHLSGHELLTKAEWAGVLLRGLNLPDVPLQEVPWEKSGQTAPRPLRVSLRSERHTLVQPPLERILGEGRGAFLR